MPHFDGEFLRLADIDAALLNIYNRPFASYDLDELREVALLGLTTAIEGDIASFTEIWEDVDTPQEAFDSFREPDAEPSMTKRVCLILSVLNVAES